MSEVIELLILVMLISGLTAFATFAVVWLLWLRTMQQTIADTQQTLKEAKTSFEKYVSLQQSLMDPPPPVPLMDEEGGDILESDVDGMFIRLPPDVSPQERERIIHYLKSEGFLSDDGV